MSLARWQNTCGVCLGTLWWPSRVYDMSEKRKWRFPLHTLQALELSRFRVA
jgi:hypothetical protein